MSLSNISSIEISTLTHILQLLPNEDNDAYRTRVAEATTTLPSHLKRPNRLSLLFLSGPAASQPLCAIHRPLNHILIHSIFTLVAIEAGLRLNSLVANNHRLSPSQWDLISRVRSLHALWLNPVTYRKTFLEPAPQDPTRRYQEDECEGCILARIGGSLHDLAGLRTILLSRTRTKKPLKSGPPRLLILIDSWIVNRVNYGEEGPLVWILEEVLVQSDRVAADLKVLRKAIWKERRDKSRKARFNAPTPDIQASSTANVAPSFSSNALTVVEEDDENNDFENEIIDHYAALMSTPYLPSTINLAQITPADDATHQGFEKDFADFRIRGPQSILAAAESRYSLHTLTNDARAIAAESRSDLRPQSPRSTCPPSLASDTRDVAGKTWSAEQQAREYQTVLAGMPVNASLDSLFGSAGDASGGEKSGPRPRPRSPATERTTWSDVWEAADDAFNSPT